MLRGEGKGRGFERQLWVFKIVGISLIKVVLILAVLLSGESLTIALVFEGIVLLQAFLITSSIVSICRPWF